MRINVKYLRTTVRTLLSEGRVEDLQKQFPDINVQLYSQRDPSPTKKYLAWMIKQILAGASKNDLFPTISYFHKNLNRFSVKDINSYKTLRDLENAVKDVSQTRSNKEKRTEIKSSAETLYEDEEQVLVYVGSKESCQLYGSGTKWCITMKDASYYEDYTSSNVVFYFLLRKQPINDSFDKIAFAVKRNKDNAVQEIDIFDAEDIDVTGSRKLVAAVKQFGLVTKVIMSDAPKRPKSLLAKVLDKEATAKEQHEAWDLYSNKQERNLNTLKTLLESFTEQDLLVRIFETIDKNDIEFSQSLANNTSSNQNILHELSLSDDMYTVSFVASNTSTSKETLIKLSKSNMELARRNVASNKSTPIEILDDLSLDKAPAVRKFVAENTSTQSNTLNKLARDKNIFVRNSVAANLRTPAKTLIWMLNDGPDEPNSNVYNVARANLDSRQLDKQIHSSSE